MLEPRQFDLSPLRRAPEGSATTVADACGRVRGVREGRRTATQGFLVDEYREVIRPHRVLELDQYLRVTRSGRGTRLGRAQRREVWAIVEAYRVIAEDSHQRIYSTPVKLADDEVTLWVTIGGCLSYDTRIGGSTTVPAYLIHETELL